MDIGLRVVRGPDWKWANQDDGEGHVGTVVDIGKPGSLTSPDKTVVVQWDSGQRTNYRVGYQKSFDLRVYDSATVGLKHENLTCTGCHAKPIWGSYWQCMSQIHSQPVILCSPCYMNDVDDLSHVFKRFDAVKGQGVQVSARQSANRVQARGIFSGARVVRGPDWDWGSQDGGEGKQGKVTEIRGWDCESGRSVANVHWASGTNNVYRLGHKGKVDLKYMAAGMGWSYYRDHLPVLGSTDGESLSFMVGDKVEVRCDVLELQKLQEGHGGWNPKMAEYIEREGSVHRITEKGDIRVQYDGCPNRWTFNPKALRKIPDIDKGFSVRITSDFNLLKQQAEGPEHKLREVLGCEGEVMHVFANGLLQVAVAGRNYTLHRRSCNVLSRRKCSSSPRKSAPLSSGEPTAPWSDSLDSIEQQLNKMKVAWPPTSPGAGGGRVQLSAEKLMHQAAQGNLDLVRDLLMQQPELAQARCSGKTALQVASHQGHVEMVLLLLQVGASVSTSDEDGDTALHYSAFGNQPAVTELLLKNGAEIDAVNKGGCTTLHVAVNKQHSRCVRVLLRYEANINVQDSYGDTALHDAIGKENWEVTEQLIATRGADFSLRNKRGFNVLHHAALKGNAVATRQVLVQCPHLVDSRKEDGFAALHLASLNGHLEVVRELLRANCNKELKNKRDQTALLLAVSQGHAPVIQLLVQEGADLSVEDEEGDTCLHLAVIRQTDGMEKLLPIIKATPEHHLLLNGEVAKHGEVIAVYLASCGADPFKRNAQGKTPLDLVMDQRLDEIIREFSAKHHLSLVEGETFPQPSDCLVCDAAPVEVTFEPCGHRPVCADCCVKMRKCIQCKVPIVHKCKPGDEQTMLAQSQQESGTPMSLFDKLQTLEESLMCTICMDRNKSVAFLCGHQACSHCAQSLKLCHMCRKPVTKRINLF